MTDQIERLRCEVEAANWRWRAEPIPAHAARAKFRWEGLRRALRAASPVKEPLSFDCADGVHCYCWHDSGRYACCECGEAAPAGYGDREDA